MCDHPNREAAMVIIDPGTPERLGRNGVWCDPCLEQLVRALNDGGIRTTASCCGHGAHLGWVMLADGRDLIIADHEAHQRIADGMSLTAAVPDPRFRDQLVRGELAAALADELARHGSTMSRDWSDNDAEPVTVRLGCVCGHERGVVTSEELAADLPGFLRLHRLHVADALLSGSLAPLLAKLRAVEALAQEFDANGNSRELGDPRAATWHKAADRIRAALDGTT